MLLLALLTVSILCVTAQDEEPCTSGAFSYPLIYNSAEVMLSFGSQQESIKIIVDTGSSDLWVACKGCQGNCVDLPQFDCNSSTTCAYTGRSTSGTFADGNTYIGPIVTDVVCIGSLCTNKSEEFTCANQAEQQHEGTLGARLTTPGDAPQFLDYIYANPECAEKMFGIYSNNTDYGTGEITVCGTNPARYQGDLKWFDIDPQYSGLYYIFPTKISVGSFVLPPAPKSKNIGVFIDTGSTYTRLSKTMMQPWLDQHNVTVPTSGSPTYPCALRGTLGTFIFQFDGYNLSLTEDQYAAQAYTKGGIVCYLNFRFDVRSNVQIGMYPYMFYYYTAFDRNDRMGIAPLKL